MKPTAMALVCLLVAGMLLQDVTSKSLLVASSNCCFQFVKKQIPLARIDCYKNVSSSCANTDGIIFQMKKGSRSCAPSKEKWVVHYLKKIKTCNPVGK
ncbi:C-C motif chemokine 1 [Pteronotus mesoamericanus]|uniref:C-C motif chemokine 1 n=1 Tax=Pteronotus mesoamericanus TaxID=1884717 RepID=UPI0023EDBBAC|nr:C-C motif chemokine 1 [Pteronotus parnellii mesoamericanus]